MDAHLPRPYIGMIRQNAEHIARLEIEIAGLKADRKAITENFQAEIGSLKKEIESLKDELRSRGRVYIGEMHGTVEGDAYQRKTS